MSQVYVYEPSYRLKESFFQPWRVMLGNIIRYRELIVQLFVKDFFGGLRKSLGGYFWLFVNPILAIVPFVYLNMNGILSPGEIGVPYPVYAAIGALIYSLFVGLYDAASRTIQDGAELLSNVNYPHEVLLLKQTIQYLTGFLISFALNIFLAVIFGVKFKWTLFMFPILVTPLFFLGSALGLMVSVASIVSNDAKQVVSVFLMVFQAITPIYYTKDAITNSTLRLIMDLNPLTYLVGGVRDLLFYGKMSMPYGFIVFTVLSLLIFFFCWRLFYLSEQRVIERML